MTGDFTHGMAYASKAIASLYAVIRAHLWDSWLDKGDVIRDELPSTMTLAPRISVSRRNEDKNETL